MKTIRILSIFTLLFIFGSSLESCEASKDFSETASKLKKKNSLTFDEFKNETKQYNFNTKLNINYNSSNLNTKNADGSYELSDFDIDTDIIKKLELNDKTTYSFRIFPTIVVAQKSIYNLILEKKGNQWMQSVIEFKPTDDNFDDLILGITKTFDGKVSLLYTSDSDELIANGVCQKVEIVNTHCNGIGSCNNEFCDACIGIEGVGCVEKQYATFCLNDNSLTLGNESDILNGNSEPTTPDDYSLIANIENLKKQAIELQTENLKSTYKILKLFGEEKNLNFSNFPQSFTDVNQLKDALNNAGFSKTDELINEVNKMNTSFNTFAANNKDFNNLKFSSKNILLEDATNSAYSSFPNEGEYNVDLKRTLSGWESCLTQCMGHAFSHYNMVNWTAFATTYLSGSMFWQAASCGWDCRQEDYYGH